MAMSSRDFPRLSDLDPYQDRLSDVDHLEIFLEEIVPHELEPVPYDHDAPIAYLFAGQPGAGKSFSKQAVLKTIPVGLAPVDIGSDLFRVYHPRYLELQRENDLTADFYTDYDARVWVDDAIRFTVERRSNILLDSTLSRPDKARELLDYLNGHGYITEVLFIATPHALSRLSNLLRYLEACEASGGNGRICIPEDHDRAYDGVISTAAMLDADVAADSVSVRRRDGNIRYANRRGGNPSQWEDPSGLAAPVVQHERTLITQSESTWFTNRMHQILASPHANEWHEELGRIAWLFETLNLEP